MFVDPISEGRFPDQIKVLKPELLIKFAKPFGYDLDQLCFDPI